MTASQKSVQANGIEIAYLEEGSGPLVMLLHGFPDTAHTWEHQMSALAAAGFRAVAPFMRGYPPTQIPEGYYDTATLAADANAVIGALGGGEPAHVVGHDWGAATTFSLLVGYPQSLRRAVALSIPHPAVIAGSLFDPEVAQRAFHFWYFQLGVAGMALQANDFAFVDYLWREWSPSLATDEQIARVKATFAHPGATEAALAPYRAMFDPSKQDPALNFVREALGHKITVPTLSIIGTSDILRSSGEEQAQFFEGEFRFAGIEGGGHFLHRERPEEVSKLILDWLGAG